MAAEPRMILIAGPTAGGKSALALALAERLGGIVVNADSMQVYGDLRVLTARPGPDETGRAPHMLYGHVDGAEPYSVGRYLADAGRIIAENPNKSMIFVGGTGLYMEALTKGLSTAPPIPDTIRSHWREQGRNMTPGSLHAALAARDPEMAGKLRPSDPQRLIRALEVIDATGVSLSVWQRSRGAPLIDSERAARIVLSTGRPQLRAAAEARFSRMLEQGALEEVSHLLDRRLDPSLPVMKALGVAPLALHLRGELDLAAAGARAVTDTRRYAKRQETWFRNRLADWIYVSSEGVRPEKILAEI